MKPLYKYPIYNIHTYINRRKYSTHILSDDFFVVNNLLDITQNPITNWRLGTNVNVPDYMRGMKNFLLGLFFLFYIRKHWHK